MTFCIITHVPHGYQNGYYFAYSPYVREMNIWSKYVHNIILVAPLNLENQTQIVIPYSTQNIDFRKIPSFNFLDIQSSLRALNKLPLISFEIYKAMKKADHIHLRCPGNIGLLGCLVQVLFPSKLKTAKYAGNWDPKAKRPFSYKLQKWVLSNTLLTRNMQVLVYGEWKNQSKNVKPFFTATYKETDKQEIEIKNFKSKINFMFVGMLTSGKHPLYAVQIIEKLKLKFENINLSIFGEGIERENLEKYIKLKSLENYIVLKGNQNLEILKIAYIQNHFMILPSESEGWPKAVAEAMFWSCLPISTPVSCVANMLDNGNRGILLENILEKDVLKIENMLINEPDYQQKVTNATSWSRKYTLDYFEQEIKLILQA